MVSKNNIFGLFILVLLLTLNACIKDPTCFDGIQNQGEVGIDCCGPCELICLDIPNCVVETSFVDETTDSSTDESTDETTDGSTDESTDETTDGSTDESTDETTDGTTDDSTDDSIIGELDYGTSENNTFTIEKNGELITFSAEEILTSDGALDSSLQIMQFLCEDTTTGEIINLNIYIDDLAVGETSIGLGLTSVIVIVDAATSTACDLDLMANNNVLNITAGGVDEKYIEGTLNFECDAAGTTESYTNGVFYLEW